MKDLPAADSPEIRTLFPNRETREAYRFLLDRRGQSPTMQEWLDHAAAVLGKANVHAQRRLREVRRHFTVETRKADGRWTYELIGRKQHADNRDDAVKPAHQAAVFTVKGRFCHMCGRGPQDGVKLKVGYKVPPSWGGSPSIDNLEPLCEEHFAGSSEFAGTFSDYATAIREAIDEPTPWERIGALLRAMREEGKRVPADLLTVVAQEENRGDPARRLRDLRVVLGWDIKAFKRKIGRSTQVEYELIADRPWPPEGAKEAVNAYERARKRRKAAERRADG